MRGHHMKVQGDLAAKTMPDDYLWGTSERHAQVVKVARATIYRVPVIVTARKRV
jgi:hypothetical protein